MPERPFKLGIYTRFGPVYEGEVLSTRLPLVTGSLGVWNGHAPMLAEVTVGLLEADAVGGDTQLFAVSEGFAEISAAGVSVLCRSAERSLEIDLERAEQALERARLRLAKESHSEEHESIDEARAQRALQRALNRLKVSNR